MWKKKKGFTLVEVIVVLVILAILAAIAIPALTGYIDRAKQKTYETEAKGIFTAAQAAVAEEFAENPDFQLRAARFTYNGVKCGRVTNNMLYTVQRGGTPADEPGAKVDYAIAQNVLLYLDSLTYSSATYQMNSRTNPLGQNVTEYEKTHKQPGISICYDAKGIVQFVEFGKDGILVHIDQNGVTTTKNGTFLNAPN